MKDGKQVAYPIIISLWLYRKILYLFPRRYEYRDMVEVIFEEQCCNAYKCGWWKLIEVWLCVLGQELPREQWQSLVEGVKSIRYTKLFNSKNTMAENFVIIISGLALSMTINIFGIEDLATIGFISVISGVVLGFTSSIFGAVIIYFVGLLRRKWLTDKKTPPFIIKAVPLINYQKRARYEVTNGCGRE